MLSGVVPVNSTVIVVNIINLNICLECGSRVGNYRSVNPLPITVTQYRGRKLLSVGDTCCFRNYDCGRSCLLNFKRKNTLAGIVTHTLYRNRGSACVDIIFISKGIILVLN